MNTQRYHQGKPCDNCKNTEETFALWDLNDHKWISVQPLCRECWKASPTLNVEHFNACSKKEKELITALHTNGKYLVKSKGLAWYREQQQKVHELFAKKQALALAKLNKEDKAQNKKIDAIAKEIQKWK